MAQCLIWIVFVCVCDLKTMIIYRIHYFKASYYKFTFIKFFLLAIYRERMQMIPRGVNFVNPQKYR